MTDNGVVFGELDVPVNAAATALKDYLKQIPPLLPQVQLEELTSIASKFTPTLHSLPNTFLFEYCCDDDDDESCD